MSRNNRNKARISKGIAKAIDAALTHLAAPLQGEAEEIMWHVYSRRKYLGFTGNAPTSYTASLFLHGKEVDRTDTNIDAPPIHAKVKLNETLFLEFPYEGPPRRVTGEVELLTPYAAEIIDRIMTKPLRYQQLSVRLAVGVEYNEFIDDPIGNMHLLARKISLKNYL